MNAKRQLSGLNKRNFSNKSAKENIKYLVKKYELLGYAIPSYLQGKTLTKTQLAQAINKITTGLNSAIKKEKAERKKQSRSKSTGINFTTIKKAEAQFRNAFNYASELEKEVFLNNKTASFLGKFEVGSPLNFYNFKNKKEFDEVLKSIAPGLREQFKQDYLNMLKHNNPREIMERLENSFNIKKQGFYNPTNVTGTGLFDDHNLNKQFRELDYVRKMEMLSIMDDGEYTLMVESLIKQGFSEPLAIDTALKNLGFKKDGDYQLLE